MRLLCAADSHTNHSGTIRIYYNIQKQIHPKIKVSHSTRRLIESLHNYCYNYEVLIPGSVSPSVANSSTPAWLGTSQLQTANVSCLLTWGVCPFIPLGVVRLSALLLISFQTYNGRHGPPAGKFLISSPLLSWKEINKESPLQRHRRDRKRRHMHHSLSSSSRGPFLQRICAWLWTNWLFVSVATVCMSSALCFDTDDTDGVEILSQLSFEHLQYCPFDKRFWANFPSLNVKFTWHCIEYMTENKKIKT